MNDTMVGAGDTVAIRGEMRTIQQVIAVDGGALVVHAETLPNRAPHDKCSAHFYVEAGKEQEAGQ